MAADVGTTHDKLARAEWRRRVAELYADVRGMAVNDPGVALGHWRSVRETLFREHSQSPVPAGKRARFRAQHFEHDRSLRFEVSVEPAPPPEPGALAIALPNSGSDTLSFRRIGTVEIPFADGPRRLSVFWMEGYTGGLFLPFRDATSGPETYGAGRYLLDGAKGADLGGDPARGTLILDFNFAYQPSCAFDPKWACPLAPPENRLDRPIQAGERIA
jgi:uncharacterized protein (DUF1684 family)